MPMRRHRRAEFVARSGRFKSPAANQPIIQVEEATDYRILNAGEVTFSVKVTVSGTPSQPVTIAKNCALDLQVAKGGKVTVESADLANVEGVFDILSTTASGRSGRFKGSGTDATPIDIVRGRTSAVYRVFNAGDHSFVLRTASGDSADIDRQCSRDVIVTDDLLSVRRAGSELISGVFDVVNDDPGLRSGRFRFQDTAVTEHIILDLWGATGSKPRRYRITNAGEQPFDVKGLKGMSMVAIVTLARDQSIDLQVRGIVNSRVSVSAAANKLITGVYDYLGEAD